MKKIFWIIFTVVVLCSAMGCGYTNEKQEQPSIPSASEQTAEQIADKPKILIAYFSRTGENSQVGYIEKGNTEIVAEMIADETGGDLFKIDPVNPYPDDYKQCVDIAKTEKENNARPQIKGTVDNMQDYDVIFLGYPIWWGDMPMAVYTFLEGYDFNGKTIIPFATHEGSGLGNTPDNITKECSGAKILKGLEMRGRQAQNEQDKARQDVIDWLKQLNIIS